MNKKRVLRIVLISVLGILLLSSRAFTGEGDTRHNQEHPGKHPSHKHYGGQHRFKDAETWAKRFEGPKVYGIDIEKSMVDYLNKRAEREDLPNLSSILGKPDDPKLPEPVDLVFICNTYHHIEDRQVYFEKLKKNLRAGARLVIVDFIKGKLPVGPPDRMKLAPVEVISELFDVEYHLVQKFEILPYQYVLIFQLVK
jgi:SAM-dependent methyltransferase